jgi:hypothetical protein
MVAWILTPGRTRKHKMTLPLARKPLDTVTSVSLLYQTIATVWRYACIAAAKIDTNAYCTMHNENCQAPNFVKNAVHYSYGSMCGSRKTGERVAA